MAIIALSVGVALVATGLAQIIPEGFGIGALITVAGAVLFGISFVPEPRIKGEQTPPLSTTERLTSIFYQPSRLFHDLRAHPRFLLPLAVIVCCSAGYQLAYTRRVKPEVITSAVIDRALAGQGLPAAEIAEIKSRQIAAAKSPLNSVWLVLSMISAVFIFMVMLAALLLLGCTLLGGHINFWQALSVAFYAAIPPVIIQSGLSLILLYIEAPEDINPIRGGHGLVRDSLNILVSPDHHPVLYTAAGFFGLVSFYGLWLTARGLRYASQESSSRIAWTTAFALWVLTLSLNSIVAALYPNFV